MPRKNFDDSVTIMARITGRLARIAFTKLQKATFGTRRVALESKKIASAYESLVLSLLLYGPECSFVSAENMRLLQRFHRKCIPDSDSEDHVQGHSPSHSDGDTRRHLISTEELEATLHHSEHAHLLSDIEKSSY
jgi:hypothetical protein